MMMSAMPLRVVFWLVEIFAIDQAESNLRPVRFHRRFLSKIRHHRLLLDALLDAAIQLRQRDDGTFNSLASALSDREISEISVARFSLVPATCMSCR
jgi:hypothetical protein